MKNPWVIAFLNYLFWGLGSLILGKRVVPSILLLIGNLLLRYADVMFSPVGPEAKTAPQLWPFIVVGMAIAGIGLGISGYHEAKEA